MNKLQILVVDDHALVREGLCQILQGLDEPVEVLQAQHGPRAFELAALHPDLDLVLLDYDLPGMNGLDALKVLGQAHPELPILMLSGMANPQIVRSALACGAAGFLSKNGDSLELLSAVRLVLAGEVYVRVDLLASAKTQPQFTLRQGEVLTLLLEGRSNKNISDVLALSDDTVKNHVTALLRAFDVKTRVQLVLAASRQGYAPSSAQSI
ncbi:MAG: response regulator transcription factor [Gammaproteobacteria bacterium]|uniref:response regulator n=1 Tax=Rhodoferax sp. TaxID=50421 RepID=UPI00183E376A|nr:response regulator transcription factor [Rhodoferax sp.]MBU3899079.1 response regulator transcription factor [Gammaproteobacteria bacterium]MBA3057621.1 response regulator transcription factor [Rhodoferax sp.]MBU3997639.1 response regulator transcription factor [Gammaproteobacteria bacterium]MBU4018523.1 response regulator transcription factor [Gammaproteobacteria bacterium]MBU4080535.1 response regulator transcription factor [Gammaproteobacteria bacterium]